MKKRLLAAVAIAASVTSGFVACVSDSTVTTDAGADATPDVTSGTDATSDVTGDVANNDATVDAPSDVVDATTCSDPLVGGTVNVPANTFNSFVVSQSDPLQGGDYFLTVLQVYNGCNFNCPTPHKGTLFGGLKITNLGSGNYTIERHIEMQQTNKSVRLDKFNATFDQLGKTMKVTETCSADGGTGDAGSWTALVVQNTDGGTINFQQPDIPVELVNADGGAAGNGTAYVVFQKQ